MKVNTLRAILNVIQSYAYICTVTKYGEYAHFKI